MGRLLVVVLAISVTQAFPMGPPARSELFRPQLVRYPPGYVRSLFPMKFTHKVVRDLEMLTPSNDTLFEIRSPIGHLTQHDVRIASAKVLIIAADQIMDQEEVGAWDYLQSVGTSLMTSATDFIYGKKGPDKPAVDPEVEKILANLAEKAKKKRARVEERVGPPTPEEKMAMDKAEGDLHVEYLRRVWNAAREIINDNEKPASESVRRDAQRLKASLPSTGAEDLINELGTGEMATIKFWDEVRRAVNERIFDQLSMVKHGMNKVTEPKVTVSKSSGGTFKRERKGTIDFMYNECLATKEPITVQLRQEYSLETLPWSANPACWCQGRAIAAEQQRGGTLDYYFNNYNAMRKCLSEECEMCHLTFRLHYKYIRNDYIPDDNCRGWSKSLMSPYFSNEDDKFEACKRYGRAFLLNERAVNVKLADFFGGVTALRNAGDCQTELATIDNSIDTVADEVCYLMACCNQGQVRDSAQLELFRMTMMPAARALEKKTTPGSKSAGG